MSASVRLPQLADVKALQRLDPWPKEHIWQQKIAGGEVIVLEVDGVVVGLARYAVLWTTVPFLGLIEIAAAQRGRGTRGSCFPTSKITSAPKVTWRSSVRRKPTNRNRSGGTCIWGSRQTA